MRQYFFVFYVLLCIPLNGRPLDWSDKKLTSPPPRIIRTCCSFGVDVKMAGIPFVRYNDITGLNLIGPHKYLGGKQEGNGILYTRLGGFVDIGHVRDQADWTAYLYHLIMKNRGEGQLSFIHKLGYEGGPKVLQIVIPTSMVDQDIMILAGRIAYDLSVWHEIGTWNGTSLIPMLPERYSAFSIEDAYSNLLGVRLGIEALKSDLPFEEAMTQILMTTLTELEALTTLEETHTAMLSVEGDWWSNRVRLPNANVIKKREFGIYPCIQPTLLPADTRQILETPTLCLPLLNYHADPNQFYSIYIQLNNKFPVKEIFAANFNGIITQRDFPTLINFAAQESEKKFSTLVYKESRPRLKFRKPVKVKV